MLRKDGDQFDMVLLVAEECYNGCVEILCIFPMYIQHTTMYSFT